MRVSCARKSTLWTRSLKRESMDMRVGITLRCSQFCFKVAKGDAVDVLCKLADATYCALPDPASSELPA